MRSILLTLLLCSSALGQDTVVTDTAVKVGTALTCPRFSALYENKLIIAEGQVYNAPALTDFDAVEVRGILRVPRDTPSVIRCNVLQVLPGGSLDQGSSTDPVLAPHEVIIKDSPLLAGTDGNLGPDPEQFGSGILIFGEWKSYGRQLNKTWTTMQPVAAGATTLTLTDAVNWQVGDELLIPDTRRPYDRRGYGIENNYRPVREESTVRIAAISGNTITLSKPLDFDHSAVDGQLPHVANCTRNIVIRSENPSGVRGHAMFMGSAHVSLYYTSFLDLGRTRPEPNVSFDPHTMTIGTNQIARYGGPHWHHVHGHYDAQGKVGYLVGCYGADNLKATKWFQVQHGTHDLLVTDNVSRGFVGAAHVTEDGFEVRGTYLRNFAAYCLGGYNGSSGGNRPKFNIIENAPGKDGAAFWFHGSEGLTVEDNVAYNCAFMFSPIHMGAVQGRSVPVEPNSDVMVPFASLPNVPKSVKRNKAIACWTGGELWAAWAVNDFQALNCETGWRMGEGSFLTLDNFVIYSDSADVADKRALALTDGIRSGNAYTGGLVLSNGRIEGFEVGLHDSRYDRYQNLTLKNLGVNLERAGTKFDSWSLRADGIRFEHLIPTTQDLISGQGSTDMPGSDWLGYVNFQQQPPYTAENLKLVSNINGDGKSYRLMEPAMAAASATRPAWLVGAKAELIGDVTPPPPVNNPPVVSAITPSPTDVDLTTPGVQEYVGPVTYSFTASDPDNDPLTVKIFYSINGGSRFEYTGPRTATGWTFTYSQPVNYVWTVQADDGKGGVTESSLAVQVIAQPTLPPTDTVTRAEFDALKGWIQRVVDHLRSTPQQ